MSNVMSLKDIRNKVHRNSFDKSCKSVFSAKAGELLPVWVEEVLPGDKFKIDLSSFTRTMPLDTAAYTRIREYYDFYFVPIRQLWRFSDNFFTQMKVDYSARSAASDSVLGVQETHPYLPISQIKTFLDYTFDSQAVDSDIDDSQVSYFEENELGFSRYYTSRKLLEYLGYSNAIFSRFDTDSQVNYSSVNYGFPDDDSADYSVNPFPLLAYQKIYADYYRFDQWEEIEPWTFNVDYLSSASRLDLTEASIYPSDGNINSRRHTLLDLRYCNWDKGLFTGLLSSPQYGDTSVAAPLVGSQYLEYDDNSGTDALFSVGEHSTNLTSDANLSGLGLSVLALRQAEFLQKWKEVSLSGKQDYKDQIKKHWNVDVSKSRSALCSYLGGSSSSININEVVNTNLASSSYSADIAGKGAGVTNKQINFDASEHGIIMCIYHAVPLLDFTSLGMNPLNLKFDFTDYAIPELDSVGMQTVPLSWLFAAGVYNEDNDGIEVSATTEMGYAPRYIDYKTSIDRVKGVFNTTLKNWVTPVDASILSSSILATYNSTGEVLSYPFFKVNPSVMDNVFAVAAGSTVDTDQFLVNSYFDVKCVRNLDYNGLPY